MLKKAISLIVGAACLVSMTSAFAATYTGTTTTYKSDGTIQVDSTVTGGTTGEVATYLVYSEDLNSASEITDGSDIVYVDQYKFVADDSGSKTFSYQTSSANVGAKIAVGASVTSVSGATIPGIPVSITEDNSAPTTVTATLPEEEDGWVSVPFNTTGKTVTALTVNSASITDDKWFVGVNAIWIDGDLVTGYTSENGFSIAVTTQSTSADITASTIGMAYFPAEDADTNDDGSTAPSIVVVGDVDGNAEEFGIILAKSESDAEQTIFGLSEDGTSSNAVKLAALGRNTDGKFAIRVYDENGFSGALYAVTYYKDNSGYNAAQTGKWITIPTAE
ncbi:MAG: hypothetical protein U0L92_05240 [Clostridia bacterium]|nr:hypothetical protein [Clostridia bacterium]